MILYIHVPMFGSPNIEAKPLVCSACGRKDDWVYDGPDVKTLDPGEVFICGCGTRHIVNWGLEEPDHLSTWINAEYCPHRLCRIKWKELCESKGYQRHETGGA